MQDDNYIISINPIDRPNRARDTLLTLVMWGIYIYLWVPLITLGAWLLGFEQFYEVMVSYGGFAVALGLLDLYALMIITIAVCIVSWSGINYYRFHNRERRAAEPLTDDRKIGEFFGIPESEAKLVRHARRLQIDLDEFGRIVKITHNSHAGADVHEYSAEIGDAARTYSP